MKEYEVGEVFEYEGKKLQVIKSEVCSDCYFADNPCPKGYYCRNIDRCDDINVSYLELSESEETAPEKTAKIIAGFKPIEEIQAIKQKNHDELLHETKVEGDNKYLDAVEAVNRLTSGEHLRTQLNSDCFWDKDTSCFLLEFSEGKVRLMKHFNLLRPYPKKRLMTQEECRRWACSKEAKGWMVRYCDKESEHWNFPREVIYVSLIAPYQRAKILSDLSGIDPDSIIGFETEDTE